MPLAGFVLSTKVFFVAPWRPEIVLRSTSGPNPVWCPSAACNDAKLSWVWFIAQLRLSLSAAVKSHKINKKEKKVKNEIGENMRDLTLSRD
jgi:hypothetical protein